MPNPSKKPHILIFNPDQWRGDVMGHLGNPGAITPHLDQLVQNEAVSFRHAFCQNPVCTPSRCSFMTGWYPHVRGHRTMFRMLQRDEPCLLQTLKENGWHVWWGGKNDLIPGQHGAERICHVKFNPNTVTKKLDPYHSSDDWRGSPNSDTFYSFLAGKIPTPSDGSPYLDHDWACIQGAMDQIKNRPADKPLCMFLPLGYPHPPYAVEDPWYGMIDRAKLPPRIREFGKGAGKASMLEGIRKNQNLFGLSEERWTEIRTTYYGMCARVDHQLGMMLQALKDAGIYDDTAIFFFSDHGDYTGDYGVVEKNQNTFEDCLTRVPFIIKPPKGTSIKPRVSDAMVELIDFPATVEALTGLQPAHTHFGRSLLPLIAGETEEHRDAVFSEGGRLHGERHCMELEANQSKDFLYWPRMALQREEGPEHGKGIMCRTKNFKYIRRLYEKDELYDLQNDPQEIDNRIDDPQLSDQLQKLRNRLLTHFMETCDVVPHQPDNRKFERSNSGS